MIVDDDQKFREAITRTLTMNQYTLIEAENGKEALDVLTIESVDLILSDVKMPVLNGIELLHRVKRDKGEIPFIMMTGFSEIIEIKEAYEIGANGFLPKPYREEDQTDLNNSNYVEIPIDYFVGSGSIKYSLYLCIEDNKFVKIANEGEELSSKRISLYKEKGVKFFHILKSEFDLYLDFNFLILDSIMRGDNFSLTKKIKFLKILLSYIQVFWSEVEITKEVFPKLELIQENILKLIGKKENV